MDDILVCATNAKVVYQLKDLIVASNNELHFTSENPVNGCLVFEPDPGGVRVVSEVWQFYGQAPASGF